MNDGIIMNGNSTILGGQIVVGHNSKAISKGDINVVRKNSNDLDKQLNEVALNFLGYKDSLDNTAEILEILYSLRDDLKNSNPNKDAIGEKFNKLISSASSITSLLTAVNALKTAVFAII
jgi:hypothetical protein